MSTKKKNKRPSDEYYYEVARAELNSDDYQVEDSIPPDHVEGGAWVTIRKWVYDPDESDL